MQPDRNESSAAWKFWRWRPTYEMLLVCYWALAAMCLIQSAALILLGVTK